MSEKPRYPLAWPAGWKRTPASQRQVAHFSKVKTEAGPLKPDNTRDVRRSSVALSVADATRRLEGELDRLGAAAPILSTNQELRLCGAAGLADR